MPPLVRNEPSSLVPEGCEVFELASPEEDGTSALGNLVDLQSTFAAHQIDFATDAIEIARSMTMESSETFPGQS